MSDIFLNGSMVFSFTDNGDSFVGDGECTQDTKPARNVTFPFTWFSWRSVFLLIVSVFVISLHMHNMCRWLKVFTAQVTTECCVRKTFVFTFSAAWHTAHFLWWFRHHWAFLHFSFAFQSALRPDHQRDLCRFHILTRFTIATIQWMCLSVLWPMCTRLQVTSPRILQKRSSLCKLTIILPKTEYDIDWWFSRRTSRFSSWIGLGRWVNTFCWFWHCIYTKEKQVLTDQEFVTLREKIQCQKQLSFEREWESFGKPVAKNRRSRSHIVAIEQMILAVLDLGHVVALEFPRVFNESCDVRSDFLKRGTSISR